MSLRPWGSSDAPALLEVFRDPAISRWTTQRDDPDEDMVRAWLAGLDRAWDDGSRVSWAAVAADGALLGGAGLKRLDLALSRPVRIHADVSYWVAPPARGRRLATTLATAVAGWAWQEHRVHRVELHHEVDNDLSCRVAASAGYTLEGTMRRSFATPRGFVDEHLHARIAPGWR